MKRIIVLVLALMLCAVAMAESVSDIAIAAGYEVNFAEADGSMFTQETIDELVAMGNVIAQADIMGMMQMLMWTENGQLYGIGDFAFDESYDMSKMHKVFFDSIPLMDWDAVSLSIQNSENETTSLGYVTVDIDNDEMVLYDTIDDFVEAAHSKLGE